MILTGSEYFLLQHHHTLYSNIHHILVSLTLCPYFTSYFLYFSLYTIITTVIIVTTVIVTTTATDITDTAITITDSLSITIKIYQCTYYINN